MALKQIDTLLIDLDNTLFDWFAVWHASFDPIYRAICDHSKQEIAEVESDIRRVHQYHRTSEYSFLIDELDVLKNLDKKGSRRQQLAEAIQASKAGRDKNLKLYDGVFKSLWDIKSKGSKIIAYTESMSFYSAYRLKRFGLDGVIDVLYSPRDHVIPYGTSLDELRRLPDEYYQLQVTEAKYTPAGELKPNPKVLLDILKEESVAVDSCVYVGDSLFKDVAMARDVGVLDAHAEYGVVQDKPEYGLLQRVSHWTEEDVHREKEITKSGHNFEPSITLKQSFCEIFMYCDFRPFFKKETKAETFENSLALETWKKTVEVQQHFNDMQMRLRNFAITIVGALIAAIGFTYQSRLESTILGFAFPTATLLILAAILAWAAFCFMDRFGYHSLLKGSVDHAGKIEKQFASRIPGIGLGSSISEASQNVRFFGLKVNSTNRLWLFYALGFVMLSVLLIGLLLANPIGSTAKQTTDAVEKSNN